MKHLVLCMVAIALLFVVASAQPQSVDAESNATGLSYGMQFWAEPLSLDPAAYGYEDTPLLIEMQVYEGLVRWDDNGNPVPAIASSWKAKSAKVWIFTLRQDVYFHNGRQVKAQDFVYSWNRVKNCTDCGGFWMDVVKSVTAVSDFKLKVVLSYSYAAFPTMLPLPPFAVVPAEAAANLKSNPVGAGPFKFKSWLKGKRIQFAKNSKYYGTEPSLNTLSFQFFADFDKEYSAFTSGGLQVSEVSPSAWSSVKSDPNIVGPHLYGTTFMLADAIAYQDARVRCGIQRAVDPNAIIAAQAWYFDSPSLATGMVTPGHGSYNDNDITHPYNPSDALSLLASAGWTDTNADGILDNGAGKKLTATIPSPTSGRGQVQAHAMGSALKNIGGTGVGIKIKYVNSTSQGSLYFAGWVSDFSDPGNDLYPWLDPNGLLNYRSHYNNPIVTHDLETARATLDQTSRFSLMHEAEAIAIETDCVVSPFYRITDNPRIKTSKVIGLTYISGMGEAANLNRVSLAP